MANRKSSSSTSNFNDKRSANILVIQSGVSRHHITRLIKEGKLNPVIENGGQPGIETFYIDVFEFTHVVLKEGLLPIVERQISNLHDKTFQVRTEGLNQNHAQKMVEAVLKNQLPPVIIWQKPTDDPSVEVTPAPTEAEPNSSADIQPEELLADGFHRAEACKMAELETIKSVVVNWMTKEQMLRFVTQINTRHGRNLSSAALNEAIRSALLDPANAKKTGAEIAALLGTHPMRVSRVLQRIRAKSSGVPSSTPTEPPDEIELIKTNIRKQLAKLPEGFRPQIEIITAQIASISR